MDMDLGILVPENEDRVCKNEDTALNTRSTLPSFESPDISKRSQSCLHHNKHVSR